MIDFDKWVELYKYDPTEFEVQKKLLLEKTINELTDDPDTRIRYLSMIETLNDDLDQYPDDERFVELQKRFNKQTGIFKATINSPEYLELQNQFNILSKIKDID